MRAVLAVLLVACSVPDKHPASDAGADAALPDGTVDSEAPDTRITQAPDEFSRVGVAMFVFESDDPTAAFLCSIDNDTPVACNSPFSRALADGSHGFVVRAVDPAGNSDDTPAEHRWTIDTTAPDTSLTERPPAADNSVFVRFGFESNENNVAFECSLDNAGYTACEPGSLFGPLTDGAHSFAARARDRAGNLDASPAVYAWSVDTATPDTQILNGPDGATGSTTATFTFISPDAGAGATFQCSLDGGAFVACSSPQTYTGLTERAHRFAVRVRDAVGNLDPTPATRDWNVDLTAPNTTITDGPTGVVPSASATFSFTSNEQDPAFECRLDGAAFAACTSPASVTMLAQGPHTFAVRAIDAANHVDATPATRTWTVDTVAPDVQITSGPAPGSTSGPRVTFAFTTTEGALQCSLDAAPFAPCTSPQAFNLPAGVHQFRVQATDAAGNVGGENRAWTVACSAPDTTGAAGLLHLDDPGQVQTNAVAGGADAVLGDDLTVEPADPTPGPGRFAGGFAFDPTTAAHVSWPALLGPSTAFTLELWARPDSVAGTRDVAVSGDGRVALRVVAASPTTVRFTAAVVETGAGATTRTATSAAVEAGAWHHVILSAQDPVVHLWVDGVRTDANSLKLGTGPALDALRLGGTYSGSLDEVWVAQTAIANDEMALQRYCPL